MQKSDDLPAGLPPQRWFRRKLQLRLKKQVDHRIGGLEVEYLAMVGWLDVYHRRGGFEGNELWRGSYGNDHHRIGGLEVMANMRGGC